jgi:cytochrome P450
VVFTRPDLFSNRPYEDVDDVLLAADPPDHTVIRRLVSPYFGREVIEGLAAFSAERATALLTPRLDIVHEYAEPLSEAVAQQLLGCDDLTVSAIRAAAERAASFTQFTAALDGLAVRTDMYGRLRADGLDETRSRSLRGSRSG